VTIAKRVRDCRYAKGWGPDELASRAEISRTALYQIECGKTETPRAATLRRIARALDVSIETLLGTNEPQDSPDVHDARPGFGSAPWNADRSAADEGPAAYERVAGASAKGRTIPPQRTSASRDGELHRKFRELLSSPLGEGLARIVEETHRLLPERFVK
jgi:transcriptional regulator with XRE-family HTH domain